MPTQFCTYTGHLPPDEQAAATVALRLLLKKKNFNSYPTVLKVQVNAYNFSWAM